MRSILALDVSKSACGWAFGFPGDVPTSGIVRFGAPGGTEDEAWVDALKWANLNIAVMAPDIVAIEAAILSSAPGQGGFTNPQSQMTLWGLQAVLRTVVKARLPGRAQLVNVASARKLFTGKGQYRKGEAKAAVQDECMRRGWLDAVSMSPDRADALCVWCFAAARQRPELAFSRRRSNVVHLIPQSERPF